MFKLLICLLFTALVANVEQSSPSGQPSLPQVQLITTLFGHPIGDKNHVLTVGPNGPMVLQDVQYLEELAHAGWEILPERVVHAKGTGAYGQFVVTNSLISKLSKAKLFESVGKETEAVVRFSTGFSHLGSADTSFIDFRGLAAKFYTEEGNWDSVSVNIPQFLFKDPLLFPSISHVGHDPQTNALNINGLFDIVSLFPESLATFSYITSDAGIPDGNRHMDANSINAFRLVNASGHHVYAKFHWLTNQGVRNLTVDQAQELRGSSPDYAVLDLFNNIANGTYPSWGLWIQYITEEQARSFPFNPFDATKVWSTVDFPLIEVGTLTLNRSPQNHFAEVEQLALFPANLVPGIEPSPDKMLAGRMFAYSDAQRYRLGTNHDQIPVNRARNNVLAITQRDGAMRVEGNYENLPNYFPNSFSNIRDNPKFLDSNITVPASTVFRFEHLGDDPYIQVREFFQRLSPTEKQTLFSNIALPLSGVLPFIQQRFIGQLNMFDPAYGAGVSASLSALQSS